MRVGYSARRSYYALFTVTLIVFPVKKISPDFFFRHGIPSADNAKNISH